MVKQTIKEAAVLILVAAGIALAVYALRPDKIRMMASESNNGPAQQSPEEIGFSQISVEEALRLYEEKKAIFADARHLSDFEAGHIKGAVHLYSADRDTWLPGFLRATSPDTVIVTYCDGEVCDLAPELAELLVLNGFVQVRYLENGWTRWRESGFPVAP